MDMDKNQKVADKGKTKYLELKYETDVQRGLSFAQVRRKRHHFGTPHITQEKKWIWLQYFKRECFNPLFFFFMYLWIISCLFQFPRLGRILLFIAFFVLFFMKIRRAFRYNKVFFQQKEMCTPKAVVLRDGIFKRVAIHNLMRGDIVRLKKGEKIPVDVVSLNAPYKEYSRNKIFEENTGRAIVTQGASYNARKSREKVRSVEYIQSAELQDLFIRQGIYFRPDFFKNVENNNKQNISVIGFEEMYFPSKYQTETFQIFIDELRKAGIEMFFFTNQKKEAAFSIGKQSGIVTEKREVIERQQFLLLKNVALEKQIGTIRIYCGLLEKEKRQIIRIWRKEGTLLLMANINTPVNTEQSKYSICACCSVGTPVKDIYFKNSWKENILQYLIGKNILQKFQKRMQQVEKMVLGSCCVFMIVSIGLSFYFPKQGSMWWIMQMGSFLGAVYIFGKEMIQELFRYWFLKKIKQEKADYTRQVKKINNT